MRPKLAYKRLMTIHAISVPVRQIKSFCERARLN